MTDQVSELNIFAFSFSLIILIAILVKGQRHHSFCLLFLISILLFSQNFLIFENTLLNTYVKSSAPVFGHFLYLSGPLFYLFVRSLILNESKFRRWDFVHFLPFSIYFIGLITFNFSPYAHVIESINLLFIQINYQGGIFLQEALLGKIDLFLGVTSGIIYFLYSSNIYIATRKKIASNVVLDYKKSFSLVKLILVLKLISVVFCILGFFYLQPQEFKILVFFCNIISLFIVTIYLIFISPEFIYENLINPATLQQKNLLIDEAVKQHTNLEFLESSKYDLNLLINYDFKIRYFDNFTFSFFTLYFGKTFKIDSDVRNLIPFSYLKEFEEIMQQVKEGNTINVEKKSSSLDGSNFFFEINFRPHKNEKGKIITIAIGANNINEKKRTEFLQEQYTNGLDVLAWKSSHILRSPVANMSGIVKVIQSNDISVSSEEQYQLMELLSSELQKLDKVINELVTGARSEFFNNKFISKNSD